jgi:signal transduction histidine kinase
MEKSLLLVDDEEGICRVLGISLMDRGYLVHTAASGEDALNIFRDVNPPIVLTDIKMPGMDGIELLRKIKEENPDTEVIMITGHGDMTLAIKSLKHDATDFVTKPISDDILDIALKRAEERITMRRKLREYTENLEQLVEEKTRKLLESERMAAVGRTIAGLSHAIKNIASGLKGGMFVLEQGMNLEDKSFLEEGWRMVKSNVDKIKNLSLDLLNYGKAGRLNFGHANPVDAAKEVVALMTPRAQALGIRLNASFDPRLRPVRMDPEAIHRCLMNLVTNALDAFKDRETEDTGSKPAMTDKVISLEVVSTSAPWGVEYRIKDNGVGMDEALCTQIFQGFFSTKGTEGTGIGLMMTKKIVDQHHGEIVVESQPGRGSAFTIRLPRDPEERGFSGGHSL